VRNTSECKGGSMSTYKCSQCGSGDIVTAFTAHVPLSVGDDAN